MESSLDILPQTGGLIHVEKRIKNERDGGIEGSRCRDLC